MKNLFTKLKNSIILSTVLLSPVFAQDVPNFRLVPIGTYQTGHFAESAAEISAYDKTSKRLFVVNALDNSLDIIDLTNPNLPVKLNTISFADFGGGVNSVSVFDGIVAAAIEASVKQDPGKVLFLSIDGTVLANETIGSLPDMITFNHDGTQVITANEGEPNADYTNDPEGSISVLDIIIDNGSVSVTNNTLISFSDFNSDGSRSAELPKNVRIFGLNASVAQDLEPEYVAVNQANTKAYVTLQENNAIAIIDLTTKTIDSIVGLGFKNHNELGNGLDASDKDKAINITTWPVFGMYQPDAIAAFEVNSKTYLVTANEGDARDYDAFSEEKRIKSTDLDTIAFPNYKTLKEDSNLGRLNITTTLGDTNDDGKYEELYVFGARSFSIWDESGVLIWDSGDFLEKLTAELFPNDFNATNDENQSLESRSDNKGPEPEGVTVSNINGKWYAFVGLERFGGVITFDISNPEQPVYVSYINNRNFSVEFDPKTITPEQLMEVGDLGPEGILKVSASDSPNGADLIIVANEVSGSTTIFQIVQPIESSLTLDDNKVVSIEGIVARPKGRKARIIDHSGAISTFQSSGELRSAIDNGDLKEGDVIRITGETGAFSNLKQLDNFKSFTVAKNEQELPKAFETTLAEIAQNGEMYLNNLVYIKDLMIVSTEDSIFAASRSYDIIDESDDSKVVKLRIDSASDTDVDGTKIPKGSFSFVGILGRFNTEFQIMPVFETDIMTKMNPFVLTILHNNDGESKLINAGQGLENFGGVARFKTLADSLKSRSSQNGFHSILVSSGDNFLAGPQLNASLARSDAKFYDALALSSIGYDAIALGNHDFDFGPKVLSDFIKSFDVPTPFLSSNLSFENEESLKDLKEQGRIASTTIVELAGEKVGIIGATTPMLRNISSPGNTTIKDNVAELVQIEVDSLVKLGINKIILISHLQSVKEDSILATQLTGIDIMIAGGGDELLANENDVLVPVDEGTAHGSYPLIFKNKDDKEVYVITTPGDYKYIGQLVVEFDNDGNVVDFKEEVSGPKRVAGGDLPDAVVENQELVESVIVPVTEYMSSLATTILATSEVALDGTRGGVRGKETNLGNLVTDSFLWQAEKLAAQFNVPVPNVAIQNGGGIRNNTVIEAGNITLLNTYEILAFINYLAVVPNTTPEKFKSLLENAVSRVEFGDGRFAQIGGFTYEYNLNGMAQTYDSEGKIEVHGTRVVNVTLMDGTKVIENGMVAENAPMIHIATIDFLAKGQDGYPFDGSPFTTLGLTYQQTLENYIRDGLSGTISKDDYPEAGQSRIVDITNTNVESNQSTIAEFELFQNYPNPFNPSTTIRFALPNATQEVSLAVYDLLGRQVALLVKQDMSVGIHTVSFNAENLSSGMYFYRLQAGSFVSVKKLTLIK